MDEVSFIKHCEKEIETTDNEITELIEIKKQVLKTVKNMELIDKLLSHAIDKREIYETLLEDIQRASH